MKQPRHEKVLQDCKDEVAKKRNCRDWKDIYHSIRFINAIEEEVLPLYAKRIAIEFEDWMREVHIKNEAIIIQNPEYDKFPTSDELYDQFLNELID